MVTKIGYIATNTATLPWSDATDLLELPKGAQLKLLIHDPDTDLRALLVKFPAGYQVPAHTHAGTHATLVLDGKMLIGGQTLLPDDFCYGPSGVEHAACDCPEGCVFFEVFQGDPAHLPPADPSAAKAGDVGFQVIHFSDLPWLDGPSNNGLPPGTDVKILVHDRARRLRPMFTRMVPGYFEPRHVHEGAAPGTVLSGKQIVAGVTLERGDFRYSPPWLEHGPFDYPEGCVVFGVFQGDIVHKY